MKTVQAKKKETNIIEIVPIKMGNFLPIEAQIQLKNRSRRHDKSKSRAKNKWKGE